MNNNITFALAILLLLGLFLLSTIHDRKIDTIQSKIFVLEQQQIQNEDLLKAHMHMPHIK